MPSTVIRDFTYDETRNELTVRFTTGKIYVYSLVPPSVAADFRDAFSKGAFFNEHIRDRYACRQVKPATRADESARSLRDALRASRDNPD